MNEEGYENLLYLSSISHTQQKDYVGILVKDVLNHSNGLIAYVGGEYNPLLFYKLQNKFLEQKNFINSFNKNFNGNFYIELQRINNLKLDEYENELIELMPDVPVDRGVTRQAEPVVGTTVSQ